MEAAGDGVNPEGFQMPVCRERCPLSSSCDRSWNRQPRSSQDQVCAGAPTTLDQQGCQSFSQLADYYRRFVPGYATMAAPLSDLTQKGSRKVKQFATTPYMCVHVIR